MQREYDVSVRWRAFPLHPDIPAAGMDYRAYLGDDAGWQSGAERLGAMAAALDLPFRMPERKYNSRRAEELAAWSREAVPERAAALRDGIFRAIWVDGLDNSDSEVLAEVAASAGIPRDLARGALEAREGSAAVDADWEESQLRGVRGVPAVFLGELLISGAQPWEHFVRALASVGAERRDA